MPDIEPTVDGGATPIEPEIPAPELDVPQPDTEVPKDFLELDDDLASKYVRVKVDGEDVEVPLSEALSGYSRTSDYTRKTQELAAQRQEAQFALTLQRALQANPRETLSLLANQYGVQFANQVAADAGIAQDDDLDEFADPLERRLIETERRMQAMQQQFAERQADEQLRTAVTGLQQRYQIDENTVRDVVAQALKMNVGPESFDMIYKSLAFEQMQARQQAAAQRTAAQQAEDQRRQQAARQAASSMTGGASVTNTQPNPPGAEERPMSLREAFESAWDQASSG